MKSEFLKASVFAVFAAAILWFSVANIPVVRVSVKGGNVPVACANEATAWEFKDIADPACAPLAAYHGTAEVEWVP